MPALAEKTANRLGLALIFMACWPCITGSPLLPGHARAESPMRIMRKMNSAPPRLLDIATGVLAQAEPLGVVAPPAPSLLPPPVVVPVSLEVKASDDLGRELGESLLQKITASPDLHLDHPGRHLRLILHTSSENIDNPEEGSVYSLVLLHKTAEEGLPLFLDMQSGFIASDKVDNVADLLMEKCMGIVRSYQESRRAGN